MLPLDVSSGPLSPSRAGVGLLAMGPRDTTGASLARLRALRGAFNETQVKDASERWRQARSSGGSWRTSPSEHSTLARALELLASRATEGVRAKGAPSRGGPVRAEVAAALRAPGSLESIATLVSSPNPNASRRACHALAALLHLLSSAASARPCASLAVALADRAARADADPDVALASASALLRLNPAAHDAVVDALRDAASAAVAAERLARFARGHLTVPAASPAALVAAALAPRAELWTADSTSTTTRSTAFAEGLLALAAAASNDGASRVAVAALDAAAEMTRRDDPGFRDALCPRDGSHSRAAEATRAIACADGPDDAPARRAAFRLLAAVASNLPPPPSPPSDDARRWTDLARACVRGVRAFAATIRGEDVRGEGVRGGDVRGEDFRDASSAAAAATTTTASLLAPAPRGFGDPPPPPPPWRAALLAAGVADALREVTESWVAAWTSRTFPGGHRLDSPLAVAAADAFVAVARLANPGDAPTLAPSDVAALAPACVAAAALVAPRATLRDEALASILRDGKTGLTGSRASDPDASSASAPLGKKIKPALDASVAAAGCAAGNLVAEAVGREAAAALCQLMDCEERGERRAGEGARSFAALDAAAEALGGDEWTRRVALHLSLGAWVTPAKATLAAALARRPSTRAALRGAGAIERVAETLARLTRDAAGRAEAAFATNRDDDDDRGGGSEPGRSRSRAEVDLAADARADLDVDPDDPDVDLPPRSVLDDDAFAPLAWRPGEASLVASCLRALAELARDADADEAAAIRTAVPELAATVRALASEEAAESLGGRLGEEARCWATLATRCLRAPGPNVADAAGVGVGVGFGVGSGSVAWGKAAVAAALADALPETYAGDAEDAKDGDGDDAAEIASAFAASPAAAPDVVFRHATGERTPAHAAILAARCPALLRGVDAAAADADRRDGSSSPETTVRVVRLGAGVTPRAFRVALAWAYSGAIDFAAIDDASSDEASTLAAVARSCGLRDLAATLRARRPTLGARVGALTRDLDALIRPTARRSDLRLLARDAHGDARGDAGGDDSTPELSAHAVVMCARSAYCRAALSPTHGFAESTVAAVSSSTRATLRLPVSTPSALAALRDACYSGVFPRPTRRGDGSWASVAVELAAGLEYLAMDAEAEACASRLTRAMRDASWRETVGVEAATEALARAATLRRWREAEAIADAVADAYPEAAKTTAFETLGEEMREAMRKAHVARARMGG